MNLNADDYFDMVRATLPAPTRQAASAVPEVVDANADGIADILTFGAWYPFHGSAVTPQPAVLMLGKGDGTYTAAPAGMLPASFTTVHPREIVQADFNKDGLVDLFIADHGYDVNPYPGGQNKLLLGKAGGGYTDASANLPQVSDFTHSASAGDINGDGNPDLFVGNMSSQASPTESYVLLGDGSGQFTKTTAGLPLEAGGLLNRQSGNFGFTSSLLADLNGDGKADLVLGDEGNPNNKEHRSLVFWNTGSGFSAGAMAYLPQGYFGDNRLVHDIASMDIDADGDQDLLLLSSETAPREAYGDGWSLEVLRNDKGSFVDATLEHFSAADSREGLPNTNSHVGANQFIRLMDVNRDGSKDIVVTQFMNQQPTANTPIVWTNDGFGHFEVALRAGQLNTLAGDNYFVGVFSVPVASKNGTSFTSLNFHEGNLYENTAWATKSLPQAAVIKASARDDLIKQNSASNSIDGGAGLDTVVYTKASAGYQVTRKEGNATVRDVSGADGIDSLAGVERIQFADKTVALDIDGTAGQAYRIYQAAFARTPDSGGLGFWISKMDNGMSLDTVAVNFVASKEFSDKYGANPSNLDLVQAFYRNVLHRDGEEGGVKFWTGVLDNKNATVAEVLMGFSESPENQAALVGVMANGVSYTPFG
ncbi:FG-GAP-like repeat-containing protein [Massilia sp. ST3]|uniref:FG-GAP-like repeat-containing protein n=1 Tax=Massilia sp. ST3 TaxID=2824903 RepID=UPI001B82B73E|nr:FG-GAP-like repeat-containing protein [Massilia sp. ST3]MBQ5948788.1 VCBS repeat-containing protein [Massilia sp. ST3]